MELSVLESASFLLSNVLDSTTPGPWDTCIYESNMPTYELIATVITKMYGDTVCDATIDSGNEGPHGVEGVDATYISLMDPILGRVIVRWLEYTSKQDTKQQSPFAHEVASLINQKFL